MYCPNPSCQESTERPHLLISERSGIEIDYCPKCRGVWLDRGELDKLIERAQEDAPVAATSPAPQPEQRPHYQDHHRQPDPRYQEPRKYYDDDHKHYGHGHYGKKKKSILSDIFDF